MMLPARDDTYSSAGRRTPGTVALIWPQGSPAVAQGLAYFAASGVDPARALWLLSPAAQSADSCGAVR